MARSPFLVVGHSHGVALAQALADRFPGQPAPFVDLRSGEAGRDAGRFARFLARAGRKAARLATRSERSDDLAGRVARGVGRLLGRPPPSRAALPALLAAEGITLLGAIGGNAHNVLGLVELERPFDFVLPDEPALPVDPRRELVPWAALVARLHPRIGRSIGQLAALSELSGGRLVAIESPPPIGDDAHLLRWSGPWFRQHFGDAWSVVPPLHRYKLWRAACALYRDGCARHAIPFAATPASVLVDGRYLRPEGWPENATHGNAWYGARVIEAIETRRPVAQPRAIAPSADPASTRDAHPYRDLPDGNYWRRSVAAVARDAVDPVGDFPFRIAKGDRIVTAGSCFAQHIARHLARRGFAFHVTEPGSELLDETARSELQYGVFSARYGNLYTTRQLRQLLERAFGRFVPAEKPWREPDGSFRDPFRPAIQPGGFSSLAELEHDRERHLAAVRRAMQELDVFVFTLGLTECFVSRVDGAVFPVCPGVAGGTFDPARHEFRNFGVAEVVADLRAAIALLREVNPASRVILTVSPVPLIATAEPRPVLQSTTWSKSVLRVAAGEVAAGERGVAYFPSYEVITGAHARGAYFADDLREVTEGGVEHVMRLFFAHATDSGGAVLPLPARPAPSRRLELAEAAVQVVCEEELLDRDRAASSRASSSRR